MPHELVDIEVEEISLVDQPANPLAQVVLLKRAAPAPSLLHRVRSSVWGREPATPLPAEAVPAAKREELPEGDDLSALKARLRLLEEERDLARLAKQAEALGAIGEPRALAPMLKALRQLSPAAADALERTLGAAAEQVSVGKLFAEFGHAGGEAASALERLDVKAATLRAAQPELAREQAFARVWNDPAHRELVQAYRAERNPRT